MRAGGSEKDVLVASILLESFCLKKKMFMVKVRGFGSANTVNSLKKDVSKLVFARQIFSSGLQWYSGPAVRCLVLGIPNENFIVC